MSVDMNKVMQRKRAMVESLVAFNLERYKCAGTRQFTHASLDDFRVIRDNPGGGNKATTGRTGP